MLIAGGVLRAYRWRNIVCGMLFIATASAFAQAKEPARKPVKIDEQNLMGTWWVKHDLGGLDGYQLERGGKLTLVNLYLWRGERWEVHKDTMTWVMSAANQKPETARYLISSLTSTGCALRPLTANAGNKEIRLYKHSGVKVTDSWVGRWFGEGGGFMDIIPDSAGYKINIQASNKLGEYKGKAEGTRITFTRNGATEYITAGSEKAPTDNKPAASKTTLKIEKGETYWRE